MPSDRFNRLDNNKHQRIMDAAIDEFLKSGYNEASINQIIKEAEISRGSFYTYFADKHELFDHIFNKMKTIAAESIVDEVRTQNGDIFAAARALIDKGLNLKPIPKNKMAKLFNKLISSKDIALYMDELSMVTKDDILDQMVRDIYDSMNDLKDSITLDEFRTVADMLVSISIKALVGSTKNKEYTLITLYKQYDIIEAGIRGGIKK